jgi:hypothetical protein
MLKYFTKLSFLFSILSLLLFQNFTFAGAQKAVGDGSFIQSWYCYAWTADRWEKELQVLKDAGMHYLVLQSLAQSTVGQSTVTYYPSSLPNTTPNSNIDMVDNCLKAAEKLGIKVFMGLSFNDKWWEDHGGDATWLYEQMEFDNSMADELWNLYKSKYPDAFYGWYWSYEASNVAFSTEAQQNELAKAMNIQLDHLTAVNKKLPFMWAPFMNSTFGSAEDNANMWKNVFAQLHITDGDIFGPQDCVGAGGLKIDEVTKWFGLLREAVDTKPGLLFWSDVEIFKTDYETAPVKRFVQQLQIEQPYVDNYLTFAYCHYYSPYAVDSGYHKTYVNYVKTGAIDSEAPTMPGNFTAELKYQSSIKLSWQPSTDNVAFAGYVIYRNGVQVATSKNDSTFVDAALSANTEYKYKVAAYDYAGNYSDFTEEITVKTGVITVLANNISKGKSYTVSIPAHTSYPDKDNKELTDGSYSRNAILTATPWEGVYSGNPRDIIIDLAGVTDVQQFYADFMFNRDSEVMLPKSVVVSGSVDKVNYTTLCDMAIPNVPETVSAKAYKCSATLDAPVQARYIKFTVTPNFTWWVFDDEFEVRNNNTTSVKEGETIVREYVLSQNYPNPFNPSTIINYQIPADGHVSLVLYNVLGKEVKTLVNGYQSSGKYSYSLDASELSSGVYFYKLIAGNFSQVKKLIKLK